MGRRLPGARGRAAGCVIDHGRPRPVSLVRLRVHPQGGHRGVRGGSEGGKRGVIGGHRGGERGVNGGSQ